MPSKIDNRHKIIGGRHRASTRYAMLVHRTSHPTGKNSCYDGVEVRISREDFIAWFTANDFSGCSVDRIDPSGHYEVNNLALIPTRVNIAKDKIKARNGECRCYRCEIIKPLNQFVKESRRSTGYSTICVACERERYHERKNKDTN